MVEGAKRITRINRHNSLRNVYKSMMNIAYLDNRQILLGSGRKVPQNVHSWEKLDENGCSIQISNQLHGAAGQARGVGHMWRCEFCLRKWCLQLISASRWEIFIKVFLLRNPSFHTGVQAKYANLWIVLEREGGVKWSVHPALSSYVYNPIVIWRVRQPYGREMLLLLAEISRIAATVRETGSLRSKFPPP